MYYAASVDGRVEVRPAPVCGVSLFSDLVVAYLFFGGAGAGVLSLVSLLDVFAKGHVLAGHAGLPSAANARDSLRRVKAFSLLAGEGLVAFGVACLVFDLGRIDRLALLFFTPSASFITFGVFSLAVLLASGALLCFAAFFDGMAWPRKAIRLLETVTMVAALFVMVYTGALLVSVGPAIELWHSWWILALFLFSSASCGCAVILVVATVVGESAFVRPFVRRLLLIDLGAIACETLFAGLFIVDALAGKDGPWWQLCASLFVDGSVCAAWWAGFVVCGLAIPFACEVFASRFPSLRFEGSLACVFVGVLIMLGGWCLRWSIVEAAQWQDMQLAYPQEDARGNASAFGSDSIGMTEDGAFRSQ